MISNVIEIRGIRLLTSETSRVYNKLSSLCTIGVYIKWSIQ